MRNIPMLEFKYFFSYQNVSCIYYSCSAFLSAQMSKCLVAIETLIVDEESQEILIMV